VGDAFLHFEREFEVRVNGLHLSDPGGDGGFARHACILKKKEGVV